MIKLRNNNKRIKQKYYTEDTYLITHMTSRLENFTIMTHAIDFVLMRAVNEIVQELIALIASKT